jgi:hypothetical protein
MDSKEDMVEIFDFPIRESNGETKMKKISPPGLPHFHEIFSEDADTFLFEF